ncbi:MAG TPA: site-specific integrase [Planctomycetaceae bacterium]|nr:site-specific integrase [Planctomycetaceae bacterium]
MKAVRDTMVSAGHCRNYVNSMIGKIKRVFRWGVEEELVPATIYQGLAAVSGLRSSRSAARESAPVRPVPEAVVNATLPHLPRLVADMVRLQLLTGIRPGEACALKPCEIDRSDNDVWVYRPTRPQDCSPRS